MPPLNEQWAFMKSLMEQIEQKEGEIATLKDKYERAKELFTT